MHAVFFQNVFARGCVENYSALTKYFSIRLLLTEISYYRSTTDQILFTVKSVHL